MLPPSQSAPPARRFAIDSSLDYDVQAPSDFIFQIEVAHHSQQRIVHESLTISPPTPLRRFVDPASGNRFVRLRAKAGPMHVRYQATVDRLPMAPTQGLHECSIDELPDDVLQHLLPTRYCESELISRTAQRTFGQLPPGHGRVRAISDWIHANIAYEIGSSDATTTARDVLAQRAGVCRDFAHLGIAFCRALNIPARFVVGYVAFEEPPPDFHAIFEAYLGDARGGRWVQFDPTHLAPVDDIVRVGTGRDAKDVAFATIYGPVSMTAMSPTIERVDVAVPSLTRVAA